MFNQQIPKHNIKSINAPKLVAKDEDLQEAIKKMEMHDLKKVAKKATHHHEHAPKLLRR